MLLYDFLLDAISKMSRAITNVSVIIKTLRKTINLSSVILIEIKIYYRCAPLVLIWTWRRMRETGWGI